MQTISVITCTYNPNPKIFERVLRSIECQSIENFDIEYVIVDNNSNPPVSEIPCVQAFLARNAWAKVITERRQGLSYARIAGVKEASSDIIIFVDDDNELDKEYIKNAVQIIHERDYVGIWGPGKISVEFVDGAPALVDKKTEDVFFRERYSIRGVWIDSQYVGEVLSVRSWTSYQEGYFNGLHRFCGKRSVDG
jgi:glycosyltransferase involved in cell wall biosynthesis